MTASKKLWAALAVIGVTATAAGSQVVAATGPPAPALAAAPVTADAQSVFEPLVPARLLDTRNTTGGHPGRFTAGETFDLDVLAGGVGLDATGVALNVTVTGASGASHLRIFPAGAPRPGASAINFDAGETIANEYHVRVGAGGEVSVYNQSGQAHVIIDVVGYYRDHEHDDRYYTEGEVDSKFAASDYVGSAQIDDLSIGTDDLATAAVNSRVLGSGVVQKGHLSGGSVTQQQLSAPKTLLHPLIGTIPAQSCAFASFTRPLAEVPDRALVLFRKATGTADAHTLVFSLGTAETTTVPGTTTIWYQACNPTGTAIDARFITLNYSVLNPG